MKHNWRDSCPSNAFRSLFPPPPVDLVIDSVVGFLSQFELFQWQSDWFWKWIIMQWFWEGIAVENKSTSHEHGINLTSWVLHGHLEEKEHFAHTCLGIYFRTTYHVIDDDKPFYFSWLKEILVIVDQLIQKGKSVRETKMRTKRKTKRKDNLKVIFIFTWET